MSPPPLPPLDPISPIELAKGLTCWSGPVHPVPLTGGITNVSFSVADGANTFVVRVGEDLPLHGVVRSHELSTCHAAHACGLAPEIVHHEPGALVMRHLDARTLKDSDIRHPETLARIVKVIKTCHRDMPEHLTGSTLMFWVFQVCRNYLRTAAQGECRLANRLGELASINSALETAVGAIDPVFCHNDLLAGNFLDDGSKIWLIDWEYAGWNTALFDLANLASNSEMQPEQQAWLLETYFGRPTDRDTLAAYRAITCASLLRESLWALVQEQHSHLDFDYAAYADANLRRFDAAYQDLASSG